MEVMVLFLIMFGIEDVVFWFYVRIINNDFK